MAGEVSRPRVLFIETELCDKVLNGDGADPSNGVYSPFEGEDKTAEVILDIREMKRCPVCFKQGSCSDYSMRPRTLPRRVGNEEVAKHQPCMVGAKGHGRQPTRLLAVQRKNVRITNCTTFDNMPSATRLRFYAVSKLSFIWQCVSLTLIPTATKKQAAPCIPATATSLNGLA